MGFFGAFLSGFKSIGLTAALDVGAALLSGKPPQKQPDLKDKSFRSEAYGSSWPRCRGIVRLQGKDLWGTPIQTSIWKTVSGGLFGIGSTSVYYNKYSESRFIGFGQKLGGGGAQKFLRGWADGKLLFNFIASLGTISGTVTVTVVIGGQQPGSQFLQIDLASGASVDLKAGDLLFIPGDPDPYTVQADTSSSTAGTISVPVWPPLRVNLAGGGAVVIANASVSPYDLSSFDPNPHDGSHPAGGYPCPPGGVAFYLGGATQAQDPTMVKHLGAANVPAYTNRACMTVHDLQLANYGDHRPAITAEIAFDVASPQYPLNGPIPNVNLAFSSLSAESIALPFSGNEALQWMNPFTQRLPYIWVFSQAGVDGTHDGYIYRVNTQTNQLEATYQIPRVGTLRLSPAGIVADNDGYLYYAQNAGALFTKFDGLTMAPVATWGSFGGSIHSEYCWDTQQSLFGNPTLFKLMICDRFIFDRTVLLPLGTPSGTPTNVVTGYRRNADGSASPVIGTGDPINIAGFGPGSNAAVTDDGSGNLWFVSGTNVYKLDMQFISFIDLSDPTNPTPTFLLPTFVETAVDVSAMTTPDSVQWYPGDNSIVVMGNGDVAKIDVASATLGTIQSVAGVGTKMAETYSPMGTILVDGGSGIVQLDLGSLQITGGPYNLANWATGAGGVSASPVYDPYTHSIWYDAVNNGPTFGGLNQALLDRSSGSGIGLDDIISSLWQERGYATSQFDVTLVTSAGFTCRGIEFERETYLDSTRKIMQHYLIDVPEVDAKLRAVPRGQASLVTIPEDDLGALDDPTQYEPRLIQATADARDLPVRVTIKHYDPLRDSQVSTQEAKRTLRAYPSSLSLAKPNTNSGKEIDIVSPITDFALAVKTQADIILWDAIAGRDSSIAKLGWKYLRYDPADVVTYDYKGLLLEHRLVETDFGSALAREFHGVSQDASVYTSSVPAAQSGSGGGVPATPPVITNNNYTISPLQPLSSPNSTTIDMAAFVATFTSGLRTSYAARTPANASAFTVPDPGSGNSAIYYVTIADPSFTGDQPAGTASLTAYASTDPASAFVGQPGYIFVGTVKVVGGGSAGSPVGTGGQPAPSSFSKVQSASFTGDSSTTSFTLPVSPAFVEVFWNGVKQLPTKYSFGGTTLTTAFTDANGNPQPADTGDTIDVVMYS